MVRKFIQNGARKRPLHTRVVIQIDPADFQSCFFSGRLPKMFSMLSLDRIHVAFCTLFIVAQKIV